MEQVIRRKRLIALVLLGLAIAIAAPRFFTHAPMRLGVKFDSWWSGKPPVVTEILGRPAEGRLEVGDQVLSINGRSLTDREFLKSIQTKGFPLLDLTLEIERNGRPMEVVLPHLKPTAWERLRHIMFPIAALIAAPLVAFLLVWRRPDLTPSWTFFWFACMQAIGSLWAMLQHPLVDATGMLKAYFTGYAVLVWWYPASFLHFITTFPRPRWSPETRVKSPWFWLVVAAYLYPLVCWTFFAQDGRPSVYLYGGYQMVVFPLSVIALVVRYVRRGDPTFQPRRSERVLAITMGVTLLLGAVIGAAAELPNGLALLPPAVLRVMFSILSVAWLLSPLVIAWLIANDPVFDPRRVVANGFPYALLTGVLAAVYLGIVLIGQRLFANVTGEDAMVFNVVAALVVAFAFAPFRERLQRGLDRLFGRDPEALREALDDAGHELLGASSRDQVALAVSTGLMRGLKRAVEVEWPEGEPPRLVQDEEVPAHARAGIENLFAQAGIRLESLALENERVAAERRAVELREAAARAELRALHATVQPHFLFNALNALSYLTETDPPAAQRFTERLADMLRYTVEASTRRAALLSDEIQFVEDYLGVARERYENPLSFEYDGARELLSVAVPPLLLQPLVENSLKHGCAPGKPLHLSLRARHEDGWLTLEFCDDGQLNGHGPAPGLGVGLENLEQRVRRFAGPESRMEAGPANDGGYRVRLAWRMLRRVA